MRLSLPGLMSRKSVRKFALQVCLAISSILLKVVHDFSCLVQFFICWVFARIELSLRSLVLQNTSFKSDRIRDPALVILFVALKQPRMKLQIDKFTEDVFESEGATDTASSDNEPPEVTITGRTAEVREHENRPNLKGERVTKVIETKEDMEDEEILKYAMRSYKTFDHAGVLLSNYVEIPSPYIKEALRVVVKEYPSQSFQGDTIIIHGKLRCLFHYRKELAAYVDALEDGTASLHIKLALRFMEKELRKSIKSYTAHVETATAKPSIEFENLWMVFKPGELIVTGRGEKLRVLQLVSTYLTSGSDPKWYIYGRFVTHDGTSFGYAEEKLTISEFEGSKEIRRLSVFPLEFHEDRDSIRESLLTRGQKFRSLSGIYHRSYDGIASALGQERDQNQWGQVDKFPLETRTVGSIKESH